jgi:hypothetical protein
MAYDSDAIDLDRTLEATRPLVDAGVTDFRCSFKFTGDTPADTELVSGVVQGFRKAFR